FFESMFAARTSRCRKLHHLIDAVIVLDEAQMIPIEDLIPCLEALRELVQGYGASVVLGTGTQPPPNRDEKLLKCGLDDVREIMLDPTPAELQRDLRRVAFENRGDIAWDALADELRGHERVLCIVNQRDHARELFRHFNAPDSHHLSAL